MSEEAKEGVKYFVARYVKPKNKHVQTIKSFFGYNSSRKIYIKWKVWVDGNGNPSYV